MNKELCPYCGGLIAVRNPTGECDHLYYPDNIKKPNKEIMGCEEIVFVRSEYNKLGKKRKYDLLITLIKWAVDELSKQTSTK